MMKKIKMLFKILVFVLSVSISLDDLFGIATNNPYDTQPMYTYLGMDKYYKKRKGWHFGLHISPFYQHANTARDYCGTKVPGGDRLGKWNMFGVFFGRAGNPKKIGSVLDPVTVNAGDIGGNTAKNIASNSVARIDTSSGSAFTGAFKNLGSALYAIADQTRDRENNTDSRYRVNDNNDNIDTTKNTIGPVMLVQGQAGTAVAETTTSKTVNAAHVEFAGLTDESNFDQDEHSFAFVSTPIDYEKIGVRLQSEIETTFGLGLGVKFGVADIKKRPLCNKFTNASSGMDCGEVTLPFVLESCFSTDVFGSAPDPDAQAIYDALFDPKTRDKIGKDLEISYKTYRKTTVEDMHVSLYWHHPFNCLDSDEDIAVHVIPYFSIGAWVPTGDEVDPNKIFSVSSGNDGFWGLTLDGSIGFDFPMVYSKNQHLQINFGAGATIFSQRTLRDQRIPTSLCQSGIIPWKTDSRKKPGTTWYGNVSFKAEEFIDGLSVYFDFIYTQHTQDDIKLLGECDKACDTLNDAQKKVFEIGVEKLKCESEWKNQQVNAGFNYQVCSFLSFGGGVQAHISGKQVMRVVTLLGTMSFAF